MEHTPMTSRAYYTDAYTQSFQTTVIDSFTHEGIPAIILEQTYFYPTGGGQPHDLGTLNDSAVVDTFTDGDRVVHLVENPLAVGETVKGQVDWARRFDHMQQHSGQHILSRAFEDLLNAYTVGFHMSDNSVTIDLDQATIASDDLGRVETLANQIVMENRPVKAWFPEPEELAHLQLRKISDKVTGAVRVVDIGGFDVCACGGTHVRYTGEIGMIKIIRTERAKKNTRLEFKCGYRAVQDYREKNTLLLDLAASLTSGYQDLPIVIGGLQDQNKTLQKELKTVTHQLLAYEAQDMLSPTDGLQIITQVYTNRETGDLNGIMQHLLKRPQTAVVLAIAGEKAHLVIGRSDDLDYDVVPLLKALLGQLGVQRGGGRPSLAQGGGFSATEAQMTEALTLGMERLKTDLQP